MFKRRKKSYQYPELFNWIAVVLGVRGMSKITCVYSSIFLTDPHLTNPIINLFSLQISMTPWMTYLVTCCQMKLSLNLKLACSGPNLNNLCSLLQHRLPLRAKQVSLAISQTFPKLSIFFRVIIEGWMCACLYFAHQLNRPISHLTMVRMTWWTPSDLTANKTIPRKKTLRSGPTRKGNIFISTFTVSFPLLSLFIALG